METEDPQIIVKLLHNILSSQNMLLEEIKQNSSLLNSNSHEQIQKNLNFLINLTPKDKEKTGEKEGLYFKKNTRKRCEG